MLDQSHRQIRVYAPLPDNVLVFRSMAMSEQLGRIYGLDVEFYSDDRQVLASTMLGNLVTVELLRSQGAPRYFTGYVTRFGFAGSRGRRYIYRAHLAPWLWMLSRSQDCKIFHEMNVVDIVKEVFSSYPDREFEFRLTRDYPLYEYSVQYRETDLQFVSRLLEKEGIYYFFEHRIDGHKMVITDSISEHEAEPGYPKYEYFAHDDYSTRRRECVYRWHPRNTLLTGQYAACDYNFKRPMADMHSERAISRDHTSSGMEVFDYPGVYTDQADGQRYAQTRIEEVHAQHRTVLGEGNLRGVKVGRTFDFTMHPVTEYNTHYLVTAASYELRADDYETGGEEEEIFRCDFTALDSTEVFRPARLTPRPIVPGPQTGVVVGEGEIDVDAYGRILVLFHWDRAEAVSMRCRVSQNWAGNGWGGMVIPRIGMEVVVEFLEGDPDRPLVTGCVYNGRNSVPYELSKHKTRSTFRTDTHQGQGYNELRFEDQKGREEIFVHAQLDHNTKVLNHHTTRIDRTKVESVGAASLREVRLVDVHNVGMDMTINVGAGPHGHFVRKPLTDNSQGIRLAAYNFEKSFPDMTGKGNYTLNAAAAVAMSAGTTWQQNVDGNATLTYGASFSQSVQQDTRENTGKNHSHIVGEKYRLDAHAEIHLRCGASEIIMKPDGTILINGKDLTAKLTNDTTVTSGANMALKASKIDLN